MRYLSCSNYSDNIYIFGGQVDNKTNSKSIYKFNCTNKTIETLSTTLSQNIYNLCSSTFGDNIYLFGGNNGSSKLNTIYKFNCSGETLEALSVTLPIAIEGMCCSIYNSDIFMFGGLSTNGDVNTIYKFSVSFELMSNNVLILNSNSKYSFDLITDQVTIPIKSIYIGDSKNTAQFANAYLYDDSQSAWVNVNTGEVLS